MDIAHFIMINNELMNKYPYLVPEQVPLIIMDIKSSLCMDKNGKDTKHARLFYRRINFVINGEEWNLHKTVCCEVGLKLEDIGDNNVREDELNTGL